jgi:hypothetical protein
MRSSNGRARGLVLSVVLLGLTGSPVWSQQPPAPITERREHVVRAGDTLWDLARLYLGNPFLWPLIYEANRQIVENPHRIFPPERLIIPPLPGETRPAEVPTPAGPPVAAPAGPRIEPEPPSTVSRSRFYSKPDTGDVATMISAERAIIRRVEPREYYATPWLGDSAQLNVVGAVFKAYDPRSERDRLTSTFHPFDRMYLSYNGPNRPRRGDLLLVVTIGRKVGLDFGRVIEPTGVVRVDSLQESTMVAMVTHQFGPLRNGDLVIPLDSFPDLVGETVPANGPSGGLIDFVQQEPVYGTTDRAFVSIGSAAGVRPGDELVALLPSRRPERMREERLPPRPIARLLVIRVTERTSTVRVISLQEAALSAGMPVRMVRRMQ